ncbi:hypothetical protein DK68_360 [Brucella suis]|nr:hypothetical protein C050_01260 [Brucella suis 92/63]ENR28539.1 hypothetical protein C978_01267 [Brucella suis 94/11]ENR34192.1 hypothetical protein C006_01276 [Brucella suis F5/03-2]ENR35957.1 hypothetical protein C977_00911 [Brucella suis F4/06-146]ENR40612.1 hypothetical protein C063_01241 [Brucella suis F8/06-2]ENT35360.1 hypothetical protein C039_01257 [Brucella suis 63/261]ENT39405.1 hypothetical protein C049_01292 [Brucella suis F12/02]ENT44594.1 hypothetical protein B969_01620 [Br
MTRQTMSLYWQDLVSRALYNESMSGLFPFQTRIAPARAGLVWPFFTEAHKTLVPQTQ